jgi:hypothetical protein
MPSLDAKSLGLEVQTALLERLNAPLESLTLGTAFKTMLEFHRDVKFTWADPELDSVSLEWTHERGAEVRSGGFLGLFQNVEPGQVTGYSLLVSRSLNLLEDDDFGFVVLSIELNYPADAALEAAIAAATDDEMIDSDDFDSLEEFVPVVLESSVFKEMALHVPRSVQTVLETS